MNLYAQYVDNTGTIQLGAGGIVLSNPAGYKGGIDISIRSDQPGAVFTWEDFRIANYDIYAQLLLPTGFPPEPPPTIQSFTPTSGPAGTSVTIRGYGFNATAANNTVYFDGMRATVTAATSSNLTVTVPAHTTYAQISVLNTGTNMQGRSRSFFSGSHSPVTADINKYDFLPAVSFPIDGLEAKKIVTADMDGDNKLDVIAIQNASSIVMIRRNSSIPGSFGSKAMLSNLTLNASGNPENITTGDLDNDGKPELIIIDRLNDQIVIAPNTSTPGNLAFGSTFPLTSSACTEVVLTDINGDGLLDIVAGSKADNKLRIFQNAAVPGSFTAASFNSPIEITVDDAANSKYVAAGDLDGDGKEDILVGDGGKKHEKMYVLRNTHVSGAISVSSLDTEQSFIVADGALEIAGVQIADMDMDGKPDILGVAYDSDFRSVLSIYRNIATTGTLDASSFEGAVRYNSNDHPLDMTVGDIDGDGKPEVAITLEETQATGIYKNSSVPGMIDAGSFTKAFAVNSDNGMGNVTTVALADMDGDGRTEILGAAGLGIGVLYHSPLLRPTSQATNLVYTPTTADSGTLSWTKGDGASRMVFVNTDTTAGEPEPVDFETYNVNTSVALGDQIGSSGWRAIYRDTGTSTVINGLQAEGTYRVMVVELNNNGYNTGKYLSTAATGNPLNIGPPVELNHIDRVYAETTCASTVEFAVEFSDSITGLTVSNFALSTTGSISGAGILSITGSGTTYSVSVATGTGEGTIRLDLVNGTGLSASITTALPYEGSSYTIDKTAPEFIAVSIVSNNAIASKAKVGDKVTLRFTTSEEVATPAIAVRGAAFTLTNTGGNNWEGIRDVTDADTEDVIAFMIMVSDLAGNGSGVSTTTDNSSVTIDKTPPEFTAMSLVSNNAVTNLAKVGDMVMLQFTSSEGVSTPTVTIGGVAVTVTSAGTNNWEASRAMTSADTDGRVEYTISATDLAGNASGNVSYTSSVVFDKVAPVFSDVTIKSNNLNPSRAKIGDSVILRFTTSEEFDAKSVTINGQTVTIKRITGNTWEGARVMSNADASTVTVFFAIRVTDRAGNMSQTLRTTTDNSSVSFDYQRPVLSNITISSGSSITGKAKPGDLVTIQVTANEEVSAPNITIGGVAATVTNTGGNKWEGSRVMTTSDEEGEIAFAISAADLSGNLSQTVRTTTDHSTVVFDKTIPGLTDVYILSSNGIIDKAKVGDMVTLRFTTSEEVSAPNVTIGGIAVVAIHNGSNYWEASREVTSADAEGLVAFTAKVTDPFGNESATVTATTDNSSIAVDKTAPVITAVSIKSNNKLTNKAKVGDNVTVTFITSEEVLLPLVTIGKNTFSPTNKGGNNWEASRILVSADIEGSVAIAISAKDQVGNISQTTSTTDNSSVTFDKTLPVFTAVSIMSDNVATNKAKPGDRVILRFTMSEEVIAPIVAIGGQNVAATNTGGNNWEASRELTDADIEGEIRFTVSVKDIVGNGFVSATATTDRSKVVFDKTIPVVGGVKISSSNPERSWAKPGDKVTLTFSATESLSSLSVVLAGVPLTATNTGGNNWEASREMTSADPEGEITFSLFVTDSASNVSETITKPQYVGSVRFDKFAPVISDVTIRSGNAITNKAKPGDRVTLRFTINEDISTPSVILAGKAVVANNTWGRDWEASRELTSADTEGVVTFTISAKDGAGNASETVSATTDNSNVTLDKTSPTVLSISRKSPLQEKVTSGPLVYRVVFSEPVKGVAKGAFTFSKTGTADATMGTVTTVSEREYDVSVIGVTGAGSLRLDLSVTNLITDASGNTAGAGFTTGQVYKIEESNAAPVFVSGATASLTICQGAPRQDISKLLTVSDTDKEQKLTWTISTGPSHGTVGSFPATATTNGGSVMPQNLDYIPTAGYNGTDEVTVSVSDGYATRSITVRIQVNALPSASIVSPEGNVLCGVKDLPLKLTTGKSFVWTHNGTAIGDNSEQIRITLPGIYKATVTDENGCTAAAANAVTITAEKVTAAFSVAAYCANIPVQITNSTTSTGNASRIYEWTDGTGNSSSAATPSFTYAQPGSYRVTLKAGTTGCGIIDSVTQVVNIEAPEPGVRMSPVKVLLNQQAQLQARTFGTVYQWSPATRLSNATVINPTVLASAEQQYTIDIKTPSGCITTDTLLVQVFDDNIYVPRVFTPNGDGQNDKLYINAVEVRQLEYLRIYDRRGRKVFETANLGEGWDGRVNGVLQPLETYTWILKAISKNGTPITKQGNVTLLR